MKSLQILFYSRPQELESIEKLEFGYYMSPYYYMFLQENNSETLKKALFDCEYSKTESTIDETKYAIFKNLLRHFCVLTEQYQFDFAIYSSMKMHSQQLIKVIDQPFITCTDLIQLVRIANKVNKVCVLVYLSGKTLMKWSFRFDQMLGRGEE